MLARWCPPPGRLGVKEISVCLMRMQKARQNETQQGKARLLKENTINNTLLAVREV